MACQLAQRQERDYGFSGRYQRHNWKSKTNTNRRIGRPAGGIDWKGIGSGLAEGAKNAFGQGEEEDDLLNTLKFGKGVVPGLGAYGTYIAGAAALATLTYANYEGIKYAYDKIKGK